MLLQQALDSTGTGICVVNENMDCRVQNSLWDELTGTCCRDVMPINNRSFGIAINTILGLPVLVLICVPVQMIRRHIEKHGNLCR